MVGVGGAGKVNDSCLGPGVAEEVPQIKGLPGQAGIEGMLG